MTALVTCQACGLVIERMSSMYVGKFWGDTEGGFDRGPGECPRNPGPWGVGYGQHIPRAP